MIESGRSLYYGLGTSYRESTNPMRRVVFDDFEAYEQAIKGWTAELRKLDTVPFRGELMQIASGPIRMVHSRLRSTLELTGTAQPGMQSFGLPMPASTPGIWCRKPASERTVSIYDRSGSFDAVIQPGFETVVFSVEPEHLGRLAEELGLGMPKILEAGTDVTLCARGSCARSASRWDGSSRNRPWIRPRPSDRGCGTRSSTRYRPCCSSR